MSLWGMKAYGSLHLTTANPGPSVCAAICPFNSPIATAFHKVGPALVTGNVIIVKPSEKTPLGTLALGPYIEVAGIPKGVVQIITGPGSTGALLAQHMRIRKISFTGSVATGKKIQIAGAQSNLKRVTLELGRESFRRKKLARANASKVERAPLSSLTMRILTMPWSGRSRQSWPGPGRFVSLHPEFMFKSPSQMSSSSGTQSACEKP